ncbi:MAG: hypothetical protein FJ272_20985 [Planctomycetes bacterium]|nr:hypothetical protein [Planctomycetota bacterium]
MSLPVLAESFKIVEAITPQAGAAITGAYISLKNVHRAFIVVHINQANAAQVAITVERATNVAGAGSVAIGTVVPIWANEDCAASDTLVRKTDAVALTTSVDVKRKVIVFQIDPATLGAYDCITVKTGASNAANITSAMYYLYGRYQSATPPSAVVD